jgi:hypothetical protein
MLDPLLWKPRFSVAYSSTKQRREPVEIRWQIQNRLTRVEVSDRNLKPTWFKAGDLYRLNQGVSFGPPRYIGWGKSIQVWPADMFYPFELKWSPVPWFPNGRVLRIWEYIGEISDTDLLQYMQLDNSYPNAEIAMQIEILRQQTMIINPPGTTTKEKKTDFLQSDNANREMVPANADRNGGNIFNRGSKALWVGFGVNAEKSSPQKVMPGGQIEIQEGFTGPIFGIFDVADPSPNAKAIVVEMVA